MDIKKHCSKLIKKVKLVDIKPEMLELPQDRSMGDMALPCFPFASELKKAPQEIAKNIADELQENLDDDSLIGTILATGPYVNFFIKTNALVEDGLSKIFKEQEKYGKVKDVKDTILIESPGPNTNKPLHLGHVRNMLLGNSLGNILKFTGHDVHHIDIVNDRGVHISKSMLAYKRFGEGQDPDIKPDHFVGKWYVKFAEEAKNDPDLKEEAQAMLQEWEEGNDEVVTLRKKMREWALKGQQTTYERYGTEIEKTYYESDHYRKGKEIVEKGLKKGIFQENAEGHIIYEDDKLGEKVVLRADGTSIYITQDIALGKIRYEDWKMDRMIYVVGNEQEHHFKFLFSIFEDLNLPFAEQCHHLSYGMVELPDGKMKSREGTVVDADDIADQTHHHSYKTLKVRYPDLTDEELHRRAEIIAMGAIKFFFLKYDAVKNFVYDKESSLRFDGETGPYVQYTYARCCGILRNAGWKDDTTKGLDFDKFDQAEERALIIHLNEFPSHLKQASQRYQPYLIARYLLDLAHLFNSFYQKHTIIEKDHPTRTKNRCAIVAATRIVLDIGLELLGIETLEEM